MRRSSAVLRAGTPSRVPSACSAAITGKACAARSARIGATRVSRFGMLSTNPSSFQALERLAHRHAADLKLRRQLAVADPGARRQLPDTIACTRTS